MTKLQVLARVNEILKQQCDDPADLMIREGEALVAIGKALKGLSISQARATIRAVAEMTLVTE